LNENQPILDSKVISKTGGVRDPHILRGEDGKTFYMVLTDMTSSKGWDSNRGLILLKPKTLCIGLIRQSISSSVSKVRKR
jgi:hypothetical protein